MSQQSDTLRRTHVSRSITVRATVRATVSAWQRFVPDMDGVQQLGQLGTAQELSGSREQRMNLSTDPESPKFTGGTIEFRPALQGRATEVRILLAWRDGNAQKSDWADSDMAESLTRDLFRFKQLVELGALPTTYGQPTGSAGQPAQVEVGA